MQPLQYDLQSSAAKDNSITHAAAAASNLEAAIPMRSATGDSKTPYNYAHTSTPKATWSHRYNAAKKKRQTDRSRTRRTDEVPFIAGCSHFTRKNTRFRAPASSLKQSPCNIMQPFQCDLQAQIPKHPITTYTQAHPKQLEATVTLRQKKKANRPQPHPPHRRGTFPRRLQPLYTEKHKVSCSGFLPKTEPLQHHAAIPMRSASTDSKTPYNYAHTQAHPKQLEATVTMRQKKRQTDRSRTRRTDEVPFIAGCSHFTRKNTRFRAPASSPKTEPLQHHAAIPMRSASTDSKTPYNYAHTSTPKAAWSHRYTAAKKKGKPTAAAPAAQTRYLSSPAAATLHGKTQGFVLRLPPQNRALATSCSHSNAICKHRFQNTL